ncbi:MAG: hypothetical protein AAB457_02760 [Patescibacteria group bacterium]
MSIEDERMSWYETELEKDRGGYFMNNFFQHAVRLRKEGHKLKASMLPGFDPDKSFRDFYEPDSDRCKGEGRHSERFWAMTPRAYDEAIARALDEKVGWDEIDRVLGETDQPGPVNTVCVPAFLSLIQEEGFTWRDLCE